MALLRSLFVCVFLLLASLRGQNAFITNSKSPSKLKPITSFFHYPRNSVVLKVAGEGKVAKDVTGEELEIMLTEWDKPLLLDAYATWYVSTNTFVL